MGKEKCKGRPREQLKLYVVEEAGAGGYQELFKQSVSPKTPR